MILDLELDDVLRWCTSLDREYKVKIGYKIKENAMAKCKWPTSLLWGKNVLPKAGVFSWLAIQSKILTHDR